MPDDPVLVVFAAASLREPFTELASAFEDAHPGVTVAVQTAGSATLVTQVLDGARADVLATAGPDPMTQASTAGRTGPVITFASNRLVVVMPALNPSRVTSLRDLADEDVKVVQCHAQVPCGELLQRVVRSAGLSITPVSLENDVTAVLTKVRLGEADAGFVYATDAAEAGDDVVVLDDPALARERTTYPITVLTDTRQPVLAEQFVQLVLSEPGQTVLHDHGFGAR